MFKELLAKLTGETADVANDVPEAWVKALTKRLDIPSTASNVPADLGAAAVSFVLTGEPASVLTRLRAAPKIAQIWDVSINSGRSARESLEVYRGVRAVPEPVLLRFARVLQAASDLTSGASRMPLTESTLWLEIMLLHSTGCGLLTWMRLPDAQTGDLSCELLERLLAATGEDPNLLVTAAFVLNSPMQRAADAPHLLVSGLPDFAAVLEQKAELVRPLLAPAGVKERVHVLAMLQSASTPTLVRFAAEIAQLAVASSRQVRSAADPLVQRVGRDMIEPLRALATDGGTEQRVNALRLLAELARAHADAQLRESIAKLASADTAAAVQALALEWTRDESQATASEKLPDVATPNIDWTEKASPALVAAIEKLWAETCRDIERSNEQSRKHNEAMTAKGHNYPLRLTQVPSNRQLNDLLEALRSENPRGQSKPSVDGRWHFFQRFMPKLATHDDMTPVVYAKLLAWFEEMSDHNGHLSYAAANGFNALHARSGAPTLLELAEMMKQMQLDETTLLNCYCRRWAGAIAADWQPEKVWPYFARHQEALTKAFAFATQDYSFDRQALFRAAATFPVAPPQLLNALFAAALGSGKTDRSEAQAALMNHAGKEARIITALTDGKSETRTVAAEWLGRLKYGPAIAPLELALKKEKNDLAKSAMLTALQSLGRPVEHYVDRRLLIAEAEKSLAKGLPKDLEWFPFSALPTVRWADTNEPVSESLLRWMLVQAVKAKSPEPSALLQTYCAMFEARCREPFGQFVLETWMREDVRPASPEAAAQNAADAARSTFQSMQSYPQYYNVSPHFGMSVEQLTALFLPGCLRQPAGSAIGSKGVLAVAAACAAERAAAPVARYLKEWYGTRAAQGKALIAMLAWIEHPSATQLVLSVGNRFRTKGFQEEASRQAAALAGRKGWTLAQLADRTMPSAGFDETGTLELSYGERVFTAKLVDDFKVELFNPDGKKIASLPEPRQDDDAERAKDAKRAFSAAKKELKSIVQLQTERLHEALCTEREWSSDDWARCLNQHPVVRKLVQRLVWAEFVDNRITHVFRPLDDGSLTSVDDEAVVLAPQGRVRVAHDSLLPAADIERWQKHFADYELAPLFQQLGKGVYALPADKRDAQEIDEFLGHLIEAFALRGRATKLGYTRGATEDGGWFFRYEKRFSTLGLVATIEFTGNGLPEENRTVALKALSFSMSGGNAGENGKLPLSKAPKILLSECYDDLRRIAAEGPGFDPDWQQKTEY